MAGAHCASARRRGGGPVNPEIFEHHEAVDRYAEAHGLAYVWEGTAAFEKRKRELTPEQYQLMAVHTRKGVTLVLMFSKEIARAEAPDDK